MNSNNNEILENISKEYLESLLKEIHHDVVVVAANKIRNTEKVISVIKDVCPDKEEWVDKFNLMTLESAHILEGYYNRIESDFYKIFVEWEKYKIENNINN